MAARKSLEGHWDLVGPGAYTSALALASWISRINGPRICASIDSSLDLDPPRLVEKHLSKSFLRRKMSLLMVLSGVQSTVSRHPGATKKVFEPGRQGEEP